MTQTFPSSHKYLWTMILALLLTAAAPSTSRADETPVGNALVIVNSGSLQTQGMAMVLATAMQAKGAKIDILLCDAAGDLALKENQNATLKPRDVTPTQMLIGLMKNGATANVCALYLPNSMHQASDLRDSIGVASPPDIADLMLRPDYRVFSF